MTEPNRTPPRTAAVETGEHLLPKLGLWSNSCGAVTARDRYPGEAKTDARDAAVIADAARTMPHTLRSLELTDEITAELTVLVGFDQDLAAEATRTSNRIRGLLTQFHPSLERVLGPRLDHQAVTWLLERTDPRPHCERPDAAGSLRPSGPRRPAWPRA